MKKFLSLALALILCLSLSVPALAAEKTLYLKAEINNFNEPLTETSSSDATFILTGDVSAKGKANFLYSADDANETSLSYFAANGPIKITVQVLAEEYLSCAIGVNTMKYDTAKKNYVVEKSDSSFFEGQFKINDMDGSKRLVSIEEYYTKKIESDGPPALVGNASVTLSTPGVYMIELSCDGPTGGMLIEVTDSTAAPTTPPAPVTPPASAGFTDVAANSPFAAAIKWAVEKDITKGKTATTFGPNDTCTVSHILTFLYRAQNGSGSANERDAVANWAKSLGIDTSNLSAPCNRAMAVNYMWKAAGSPNPGKSTAFADVPSGADYAKAVSWAVEKGITKGTGGDAFSPGGICTRGQIVTFLYRAAQ